MYRSMTIISGSCGRTRSGYGDGLGGKEMPFYGELHAGGSVPFAASSRYDWSESGLSPSTTSRDDYDTECASTESAPCKSDDAVGGNAMSGRQP